MSPVQVDRHNQEAVWNNLYTNLPLNTKIVFQPGDRVRLSQSRQTFKKGYMAGWTEELFTISRIQRTSSITYVLKDDSGEELRGAFYKEEIQKVGEKEVYRIENIIDERRRVGGGTDYLVKWFGYPVSFNSWISSKQLANYGF